MISLPEGSSSRLQIDGRALQVTFLQNGIER
jgi:hypothetical protein